MDRRAFITALIGGMAVAGLGGMAVAEAATPRPSPLPDAADGDRAVSPETQEALDRNEAGYSQYYRRRRYYRRYRRPYRRYYDRRARGRSQR
jgi:hypothetical protein